MSSLDVFGFRLSAFGFRLSAFGFRLVEFTARRFYGLTFLRSSPFWPSADGR